MKPIIAGKLLRYIAVPLLKVSETAGAHRQLVVLADYTLHASHSLAADDS